MIPIRDENPTRRRPVVTIGLVVSCVLVFFWQIGSPGGFDEAVRRFGLIPAELTGRLPPAPVPATPPAPARLVTHMFLHGNLLHLGGNMLYLWIFGNNVEDRLGPLRFLGFYLACGIAAALAHVAAAPGSELPMIGASGAVSGVLGAYLLWFPGARVLVLIPLGFLFTTLLRAWVLILVWFAMQLWSALASDPAEPGVAWWAHIGGFTAGFLLALPLRPKKGGRNRRRRGPWG